MFVLSLVVVGVRRRHTGGWLRGTAPKAADLEQVQAERFDPGQHAVQRGLVRQGAGQQRVLAVSLGAQAGERGPHRPAQVAPDADLVGHRRPRVVLTAGYGPHFGSRVKREIENRHRTASRIEKVSTAGKVPVNSDSTPTPTTGMISPA